MTPTKTAGCWDCPAGGRKAEFRCRPGRATSDRRWTSGVAGARGYPTVEIEFKSP